MFNCQLCCKRGLIGRAGGHPSLWVPLCHVRLWYKRGLIGKDGVRPSRWVPLWNCQLFCTWGLLGRDGGHPSLSVPFRNAEKGTPKEGWGPSLPMSPLPEFGEGDSHLRVYAWLCVCTWYHLTAALEKGFPQNLPARTFITSVLIVTGGSKANNENRGITTFVLEL